VVLAACSGDDGEAAPMPAVDEIAPALEALAAATGDDVELFYIGATLDGIELVVAGPESDGGRAASGYRYAEGELGAPEQLGATPGATFTPDQVTLDADRIFDDVVADLDSPVISKLEILAGEEGLVYSALVLSAEGGALLVDLSPDGVVLAVDPVT
jgi:hypothetical protein